MANTIDFILTNAASELISKALSGKTLNFTRMAIGDGFSYDTTVAKGYKTLVNEVLSIDITKSETLSASSIKVTSAFKNTDAKKEFYYREVGLYAQDPDTGNEILYAYGNRNDAAELIIPSDSSVVTKQLSFITSVGDSAKVTFNVNAGVYALQEDLTTLQTSLHELNSTKAEQTKQNELEARMNTFVAVGKTSDNAETTDIRIGSDGKTYNSAGDAVRGQYNALKSNLSDISVNSKIKGLLTINKGIDGVTFLLVDRTGNTVITTKEIIYAEHDIELDITSGYMYILHFYKNGVLSTESHLSATEWLYGKYVVKKGSYFIVQMMKSDRTAFSSESDKNKLYVKEFVYNEEIAEITQKDTLYHVIITGQSLAIGAEGKPALTTVCPIKYEGKAFMFNGGCRLPNMEGSDSVTSKYTESTYMSAFTSLQELDSQEIYVNSKGETVASNAGETIGSWLGYWVADKLGRKVLVSNHGYGGKPYRELKKGTVPYDNSIRAIHRAKQLCKQFNMNYEVMCICVVHGEADQAEKCSAETYKEYLNAWQSDYETDIKAITGQTNDIPMFISQTGANYGYDLDVSNGVFMASVTNPKIKLVVPQYAYPLEYVSVHMKNVGYRLLGEYFGNSIFRHFKGLGSNAIYPTKSVCSGNNITITFHANASKLVLNNFISVADGNYGFAIEDSNGTSITSVSCTEDSPKVTVTLSGNPSLDAQISYAYKVYPEVANRNPGYKTGIRGCLSDGGAFNCLKDDYSASQWCCVFNIPVNYN